MAAIPRRQFSGARVVAQMADKLIVPKGGIFEIEVTGKTVVAPRFPLVSHDPAIQAHYERCRLEGTSHTLAEMFAFRQPPMSNTDREFLEGHCNGNQFEDAPHIGDWYAARAREAGVDPKGKVYLHGLARYPGDPEAWVSGRGDVQKVVESRGWSCQGAVNVKARDDVAPAPAVGVADDIVEQRVMQKIDKDPSQALRPAEELKAEARDEIKPHWVD